MTTLTISDSSGFRDEGSIILLEGTEEESGSLYWFACDRRPAIAIIEALQSGAEDEITCEVEDWQIMGGAH